MPIDWDAERTAAKEREAHAAATAAQAAADHQRQKAEREAERRAGYLADAERIQRHRPMAIEAALYLMDTEPAETHQAIKEAAEAADLETLDRLVNERYQRYSHFNTPNALARVENVDYPALADIRVRVSRARFE